MTTIRSLPRPTAPVAALPLLLIGWGAAVLLGAVATGDGALPGDLTVAHWTQRTDHPAMDNLATGANQIGSGVGGTIIALLAVGLLLWRRAWWDAALVFGAGVMRAANAVIKDIVDSPRPTEEHVQVWADIDTLGFPSGHAMGTTLLGGALIVVALRRIAQLTPRRLTIGAIVAIVLIVGFARVYTGAHWPSDVLGGYLWALALLVGLLLALNTLARLIQRRSGAT